MNNEISTRSRSLLVALVLGLGLILTLLLFFSNTAPVARAAGFTVTKFTDSNDGTCDADCSLREAIIAANGNGQADTIVLGSGTYALTITGTYEDAANTGDLDITDSLTITGAGPGQTIIDANGIDRVLDIWNVGSSVVISGVTLINGNGVNGYGGAIYAGLYALTEELFIVNTTISDSVSSLYGGGIYIEAPFGAGQIVLDNVSLISNTAQYGGGIYIMSGPVSINETFLLKNAATDGGGIYVYDGDVTLSNTPLQNNVASANGGGVYLETSSAHLTQTGIICQIGYNIAGKNGGGMYIDEGKATLESGQVISNTAGQNGGSIYVNNGLALLRNTKVANSDADYHGGGLYVRTGAALLIGSQVLNNFAAGYGGGIYDYDGFVLLNSGEINSNHAMTTGGGIYIYNSSAVFSQTGSTVIAENLAEAGSGGGIATYLGRLYLDGARISGNESETGGGGLRFALANGAMANTQIINNSTTSANGGGVLVELTGGDGLTITDSCIFDNSTVSVVRLSGSSIVATGNWWGAPDGPSGAGPGSGDSVSAGVDYSGFLTSAPPGCSSPAPDISITKAVTPAVAGPGQTITYTLSFQNASEVNATGVVITDILPISVTVQQTAKQGVEITNTIAGETYAWDVADLLPGQSGVITLTATINPEASGVFSLTNQAIITTTSGDRSPENNTHSASSTIDAKAPPIPTLTSPADGTLTNDATPTLTWQESNEAAGYLLDWNGTIEKVGNVTQYTTSALLDGVYTWTVAAYDALNNTSAYTDVWTLTIDTTLPDIEAVEPASGSLSAEIDTPIVITFSESIDTDTFAFTASPDPGGWATSWNGNGTVVTLTHNNFTPETTYTITFTAADDLVGNSLSEASYTWCFTIPFKVYLPLALRNY